MLNEVLVRALVELMVTLDLSDEEDVSIEAGSSMLNDAAAILNGLSTEDQEDLVRLIGEFAESETDPDRQDNMRELPGALGLVE
ncbi:hypothetical protein [Paractinoplanes hotanensis]|uniref:Carrier domain-containing protein n=1 Tax=Paractinoplanes hotanensis TaxID=2906497 RepID=A0ABT0YCN0_9ACTN|nr:hypothetical protein [Actinoplanes hotanensis]MCM4083799.1 hypothetical protein [Actinoplanes hotanensis]